MKVWQRFFVAAMALGVDAAAKAWAVASLRGAGTVWILRPWIGLQLLYNPGASLGLAAGFPRLLMAVGAGAVVGFSAGLYRYRRGAFGLALMLGGAAGNLLDRLRFGAVVDFARVSPWPGIFNLADLFLRMGALLWLIAWLRDRGEPAQ